MNTYNEVLEIHKEIQQKIYRLLPEKFKKLYLYASMIDAREDKNGEMFLYYFPTGILKKNPVNIYMIPDMFDIDEEQYKKMLEDLYNTIKKLRSNYKLDKGKRWTSVTITIEDVKYKAEFDYEDIVNSKYDNFERHIIWRYKYLGLPIESYTRTERKIIEESLEEETEKKHKSIIYETNIYEKQSINVMKYEHVEPKQLQEPEIKQELQLQPVKKVPKTKKNSEKIQSEKKAKNQLLNY